MGTSLESERPLERARAAYRDWLWVEAFQSFTAADVASGLSPSDYELLATTSYMLGDVASLIETQEKAYKGYLEEGQPLPAARVALWVASGLASRGKFAEAGGWVERGSRLLEPVDMPCMEMGYLLLPQALRHMISGEFAEVVPIAAEAARIGREFNYPDLIALATHSEARALLALGKSKEGFRLLDEVMLSVIAGDCSPMVTGMVYCSVLEGCYETHEVKRAAVWTDSLADWCGAQADLVAFNDQCLAHRSELLRLQGDWAEALSEAQRSHANRARGPVAAQAHYQQAEIHRMRGDFERAEQEYQETAIKGGEPQPGLALLQLKVGSEDAAVASIRRALLEAQGILPRARLLPGCVEVFVATGHLEDAAMAVEELNSIAGATSIDTHTAWSRYSSGVVALSTASPVDAASDLRDALRIWEDLQLPYELARTRRELGRALSLMGDDEGARVQWEAAGVAFNDLGARPDADETSRMLSSDGIEKPFGLTDREVEVLTKLASGATNRAIAADMVLSERTIDRHVSNIFTKLGVNTRSAATAAAIRNDIA
jgi:DNA-binding CsgD family transcriptional regulator